jgi:glutathione S-transferase
MKLYYSPGACSLGIHLLLEEIGKPYELHRVNIREGEQFKPEYMAINPKSKVPALQRDDGTVLTEFDAIATYLARTNPGKNLLPADPETEIRMMEAMSHIVSTMHMQGYGRMFRPSKFAPSETDHDEVKEIGGKIFAKGFEHIEAALAEKPYLGGDQFSIGDAALFYVETWALRSKMTMPPAIAAHFARMRQRSSVKKALADEGITL